MLGFGEKGYDEKGISMLLRTCIKVLPLLFDL